MVILPIWDRLQRLRGATIITFAIATIADIATFGAAVGDNDNCLNRHHLLRGCA